MSKLGQPRDRWRQALPTRHHALILGGLLVVAAAAIALAGRATASGSGGAVTFDPQSGPVGTQVTVTIDADPPGPTPYLLSVTPSDPSFTTCASGVTLPDAPKIIVLPGQPTTTTISWPSAFFSGAYYLCASPAAEQKGPTVWSPYPFSVTGVSGPGTAPTGRDSGVVAQVPSGAVVAGNSFTLTVDAKAALGGNAPTAIMLFAPAQLSPVAAGWTKVGQDGVVYTFVVTVPADTPPGTYEAQVLAGDGEVTATSNSFQVVSSAVSHPPPSSVSPLISVPPTSTTSPGGALLVATIALLLALGAVNLATPLLQSWRRGRGAR